MPEVRYYPPSFPDKRFRKALDKASPRDREKYRKDLSDLIEALGRCRHPVTDPDLQRWRPSSYRAGPPQIEMYEFRCWRTMRVIAAWFPAREEQESAVILLVGATLSHDHDRLQRLLKQHGAGIADYGED